MEMWLLAVIILLGISIFINVYIIGIIYEQKRNKEMNDYFHYLSTKYKDEELREHWVAYITKGQKK